MNVRGTALNGETTGRLIRAAIESFNRKGYAATSVREIVGPHDARPPLLVVAVARAAGHDPLWTLTEPRPEA